MKLPRRDLPLYSLKLPASNVTVTYRPYTIKEQQLINMAAVSDNDLEKLQTVYQICENCVDYDISKLFPAEIEYIFMKIRACSDSSKVPIIFTVDPEVDPETGINIHEDCGETISTAFDIDKDVQIILNKNISKYATRAKDGSWIVDLYDGIKIQIKIKPLLETSDENIFELVESIIDEKNDALMIKNVDFDKDEFLEWVKSLPNFYFDTFTQFMNCMPKCVANIKVKCKCGKVYKEAEEGVLRFLV